MLGYIIHDGRDDHNGRMAEIAMSLMADGMKLAGAVQTNQRQAGSRCDVELTILGAGGAPIVISQSLGSGAQGCRLNGDALERAVARVAGRLTLGTDLLIVNKFGKQEAAGRGFRDLIALAIGEGIPVLTTVAPTYLEAFLDFAGGEAAQLHWWDAADWCRGARGAAA